MISLIVCHRPNSNSNLDRLFKSLEKMTSDINNIEVCIKTDEPIDFPRTTLAIKNVITDGRRGYADLHLGYQDLRSVVAGDIVTAVSDDFECIAQDWDVAIEQAAKQFPDGIFVIFGDKYDKPFPIDDLSYAQVDPNPLWSKKLLDLCNWDFGCFATDMWSYLLCHFALAEGFDFSSRSRKIFHRHVDMMIDSSSGARWYQERKEMIDLVSSQSYQDKIKEQVFLLKESLCQ